MRPRKVKRVKATAEMISPTADTVYTVIENPQLSGGTVVADQNYDVFSTDTTDANATNDFDITLHDEDMTDVIDGTVTSLTPSTATVSKDLLTFQVRHVADGAADIRAFVDANREVKITRTMAPTTAAPPVCDITSHHAGSLAAHVASNLSAMTTAVTAGSATMNLWSSYDSDWQNPVATPNSSLFMDTSLWDISGVSMWRESWAYNYGHCTLISPRHVLTCFHTNKYPTGAVTPNAVVFRTPGGAFETRNIISADKVGYDAQILYLDSAITTCKIYKVFPALTYETYARSMQSYLTQDVAGVTYYYNHGSLPCLRVSAWDYGVTSVNAGGIGNSTGGAAYRGKPTLKMDLLAANYNQVGLGDVLRYEFYKKYSTDTRTGEGISLYNGGLIDFMGDRVGGDSGSPWFVPVDIGGNKELVLVLVTGQARTSDDLTKFIPEINTAMNTMADVSDPSKGSYALLEMDLSSSGFNTY